MKRIGMLIAGAATALLTAAPAHADGNDFVNYLTRQGEDTAGAEYETVDLGLAICGMFDAGGSTDDVWDSLHQHDNAVWIVGSIHYLCPQYQYLLD